jgi:ABC-type dipeptide/oligopeptide/nickel transport system permease component
MFRYILKRVIQMVPLIVIISIIAFGIIRVAEIYAKADPLAQLKMNPSVTKETIQREEERLGLNKPLYIRYLNWAKRFIVGDMGESYYYKTSVSSLIKERLSNTLILSISSFLVTWLIAIPLGIYLAVKQYSLIDQIFSSLSYFFMGFPDFFLAILLLLFAAKTGLFPISGMTSTDNNHMTKINSIYAGKYEHGPKAKLSEEHIKYDKEILDKVKKQELLNSLKSSLSSDLSYSKDNLSTSIPKLVSDLPLLENFPSELYNQLKDEFSKNSYISIELGNKIYKQLKKMNYYSFGDKVTYTFKHIDRIIFHYGKYIPDVLYHLVLPTITLSIISIAGLQRRMRANLLDVLNEEYIRTARAKGLSENVVIWKHAVRNALNPMITLLGFEFASLLSGAAFVEILFTWPGLGQMMLEAVLGYDLNLVMAGLIISSVMLLVGNLLADLLLALTDPRIKLEA